jgi:hypothetical protein
MGLVTVSLACSHLEVLAAQKRGLCIGRDAADTTKKRTKKRANKAAYVYIMSTGSHTCAP